MVEDLLSDISKANNTQPASTIHSQINSYFHAVKSLQLLFRGWWGGSHFWSQIMALQNDRHPSAHELIVDEFAHGLHQDARHRSKVFNLQIHLSSSKLLSRFTWRLRNEWVGAFLDSYSCLVIQNQCFECSQVNQVLQRFKFFVTMNFIYVWTASKKTSSYIRLGIPHHPIWEGFWHDHDSCENYSII